MENVLHDSEDKNHKRTYNVNNFFGFAYQLNIYAYIIQPDKLCDMTSRTVHNEFNRRKNTVYAKAVGIRDKCLGKDSQGASNVLNQRHPGM